MEQVESLLALREALVGFEVEAPRVAGFGCGAEVVTAFDENWDFDVN